MRPTMHAMTRVRPGDEDFEKVLRQSFCDMDCKSGRAGATWDVTHFGGVKLQGLDLFLDEGIGLRRGVRTRRHIHNDGARDFLVTLPLQSQMTMVQAGETACCRPGNMMLVSTALPFAGALAPVRPGGRFSEIAGRVSGALLRQRLPCIDDLSNRPVRIDSGAGRFLSSLCRIAVSDEKSLSASEKNSFGALLLDALVDVLQDAAETAQPLRQANSLARMREKALAFIGDQLSNPQLDCAMVAAHCGISESYLHAAFADGAMKAAHYIREQRLLRCRAALVDPALRHHSVIAIAMRWGFTEPSVFIRAYKKRFGITPNRERDLARQLENSSTPA